MDKYLDILFEEYKKTLTDMYLNAYIKNKTLKSHFYVWLKENEKILPYYIGFLEQCGLAVNNGTIELDKIENDSSLKYLPFYAKGLVISKYIDYMKRKNNVVFSKGSIINKNKELYLEYNFRKEKHEVNLNDYNNVITQLPIDNDTLSSLEEAIICNKNVYIGTYGNIEDKNKEEKIQELYDLKNEIQVITGKNIEGEVSYVKDYYVACINPKIKYNSQRHKNLWKD